RGERRADPACSDDAHGEPRGAVPGVWLLECTHSTVAFPFQSARGTGRFLVMLTQTVAGTAGCPQAAGFRRSWRGRNSGCRAGWAGGVSRGRATGAERDVAQTAGPVGEAAAGQGEEPTAGRDGERPALPPEEERRRQTDRRIAAYRGAERVLARPGFLG